MSAGAEPLLLGRDDVRARCSPVRAAEAVEKALRDGLDPLLFDGETLSLRAIVDGTALVRKRSATPVPSNPRSDRRRRVRHLCPRAGVRQHPAGRACSRRRCRLPRAGRTRNVVTGTADLPLDRPLLFKSVGMSWEDLVVAVAVLTTDT